ncbi:hypothetical protein NKG94_09140 [Micromonospora sp. M12]
MIRPPAPTTWSTPLHEMDIVLAFVASRTLVAATRYRPTDACAGVVGASSVVAAAMPVSTARPASFRFIGSSLRTASSTVDDGCGPDSARSSGERQRRGVLTPR